MHERVGFEKMDKLTEIHTIRITPGYNPAINKHKERKLNAFWDMFADPKNRIRGWR